jgi:transposase
MSDLQDASDVFDECSHKLFPKAKTICPKRMILRDSLTQINRNVVVLTSQDWDEVRVLLIYEFWSIESINDHFVPIE